MNTPIELAPTTLDGLPVPSPLLDTKGVDAPAAPASLQETGIDDDTLCDLALKLAYTVPRFNTQWATERLCLPTHLVGDLLTSLRKSQLVEVLGQAGSFGFQYAITGRGCEYASRLMNSSAYVGPAPVSLESYREALLQQMEAFPRVEPAKVKKVLSPLVLPDHVVEVAGLAAYTGRSLFLHGPPGNGKTTLGLLLHQALDGELWIPHAIGVDGSVIRVFDPKCHQRIDRAPTTTDAYDRRWIRIRRPLVVVGGELTIEALDLTHNPAQGCYEAPLHLKANGGIFLLDDFGCQKVESERLLNRWIHPLEHKTDYLAIHTGQQIEVPFVQMLIVSTNREPEKIMSPAFLRRMGYRLELERPSAERYREIFRRYAARQRLAATEVVLDDVLLRYRAENRSLSGCQPRDLVERAKEICAYEKRAAELSEKTLETAWRGYFGVDTKAEG